MLSKNQRILNFIPTQNKISIDDLEEFDRKILMTPLEILGNSITNMKNSYIAGIYIMEEIQQNCIENYLDHVEEFNRIYNDELITFVKKFYIQINDKLKEYESPSDVIIDSDNFIKIYRYRTDRILLNGCNVWNTSFIINLDDKILYYSTGEDYILFGCEKFIYERYENEDDLEDYFIHSNISKKIKKTIKKLKHDIFFNLNQDTYIETK